MRLRIFYYVIILVLLFCCKGNNINYNEILNPVPPTLEDLNKRGLYKYIGDTISSLKKISNNNLIKKLDEYDKNNTFVKEADHTIFYIVPKIYTNIQPVNNKLPYKYSGEFTSYKEFYKYIRENSGSTFIAYVINNNEVVFKDYIKEYSSNSQNTIKTNTELFNFLDKQKFKYTILKNEYDSESGRYNLLLKFIKKQDSTLNYIRVSKFEFESRTFYKGDTLVNWNHTTHKKFGY